MFEVSDFQQIWSRLHLRRRHVPPYDCNSIRRGEGIFRSKEQLLRIGSLSYLSLRLPAEPFRTFPRCDSKNPDRRTIGAVSGNVIYKHRGDMNLLVLTHSSGNTSSSSEIDRFVRLRETHALSEFSGGRIQPRQCLLRSNTTGARFSAHESRGLFSF